AVVGVIGFIYVTSFGPSYAQGRLSSYVSSVADVTQSDYHVQQAIIAFNNGGLMGVGVGQGKQKFCNLAAPRTDINFAVVGDGCGAGCWSVYRAGDTWNPNREAIRRPLWGAAGGRYNHLDSHKSTPEYRGDDGGHPTDGLPTAVHQLRWVIVGGVDGGYGTPA